jgi:hypothetical protein
VIILISDVTQVMLEAQSVKSITADLKVKGSIPNDGLKQLSDAICHVEAR